MKQEILAIISKKYSDDLHLAEALNFAANLIDTLQKLTNQTEQRFLSFLEKYNFETIEKFSEYPEYPSVTLFKGIDNWTLSPVIDYEGGVTDVDQEIGVIFYDPELYPDKEYLYDIGHQIRGKIILTWLSKIWFDIKGSSYGIVVKTLENNSCSSFFFNDLAWDNLSEYREYNDRANRLNSFFSTDLDILTIYQRVSLITYPVYPYINKWRFFRKAYETIEFVSYGNETAEISSVTGKRTLKEHKTLFEALKYEQVRTLELVTLGYFEFLTDTKSLKRIYEGAIETKFHSGEHWYYNEQQNRLSIAEILEFERQNQISLPFHFKHYLRLFNGRKYNNINMYFCIGDDYLRVKEFYNFDEIKQNVNRGTSDSAFSSIVNYFSSNKKQKEQWLDIGDLYDENKKLSLNLTTSKLAISERNKIHKELDVDFEFFIREPKNYSR
jgi:hypothetical protein